MKYRLAWKKFKYSIPIILISAGILFYTTHDSRATIDTYYFNNAVNTNPATLGNYWMDSGATVPATVLPDLSEDEVTVLPGATYAGNAIFNGFAANQGNVVGNATFKDFTTNEDTVTGNATFVENDCEDYGTVTGTRTRKYITNSTPFRNFTDHPWTILADGAIINLLDATFDTTTTLTTANGGSFTNVATLTSASAINSNLTLDYSRNLDSNSVPSGSDFTVIVAGASASVTNVTLSSDKVILTLSIPITDINTTATVSYTPGSAPIKVSGISIGSLSSTAIKFGISVGAIPYTSTAHGTKLYVGNTFSDNVTVIDTLTNQAIATIPVGDSPEYNYSAILDNKVYVTNKSGGSVSVIDTTTDTVSATITGLTTPQFPTIVGRTLYVVKPAGNGVSAINTTTNTVTANIAVGSNPYYIASLGTKLYAVNASGNSISVIDTTTNTVSATISVGTTPQYIFPVGTKLYVSNNSSDTVSVINSLTNTVTSTISVGDGPTYFSLSGTKLYVTNLNSDNVSVINTATDTVTATIAVGDQPFYSLAYSGKIFIGNRTGNGSVSVIDTATDTVVATVPAGSSPYDLTLIGNKIYVNNIGTNNITIIDTTNILSERPRLTSFTSSSSDGVYTGGQTINITANFDYNLVAGSTMTVTLNSGASVVLNTISGSTLQGTYTVGSGQSTPDLSVSAITSASIDDTNGRHRTNYSLPSSQGDLVAENSFITRNIGDSKNIIVGSVLTIPVGEKPYQISIPVTVSGTDYLYVANQKSGTVSVIKKTDHSVVATITVGSEPYGLVPITVSGTTYIYVANTGSNTVSVINTATNAVTATISVGIKPYYVAAIGTTAYVTNSLSNSVSVINAATNTVTATVPVGAYPRGIKASGTSLYVANYGDPNYSGGNTISVINSATNTVSATIILPAGSYGPRGVTALGSNIYVANYRSNNVSVINTGTNAVTATITVGTGPRGIIGTGTTLYVENFDDGTISVIDTGSNTVTATVKVGHSPAGMAIDGTNLYYTRFQDDSVSILKTATNTLRSAAAVISDLQTVAISSTSASIAWTTNKTADSLVEYGLTTAYGSSTSSTSFVTSHSLSLTGLTLGTVYHYRVTSIDTDGNITISGDGTFRTLNGGIGIINPPYVPAADGPDSLNHNTNEIKSEITPPEKPPGEDASSNFISKLKGLFLLAIEDHNRLWYVNPGDEKRYEVRIGSSLALFRKVALGITNQHLRLIPIAETFNVTNPLLKQTQGRILLQTESKGETWYVDQTGKRYSITIKNIVELGKNFALEIINDQLNMINQAVLQ